MNAALLISLALAVALGFLAARLWPRRGVRRYDGCLALIDVDDLRALVEEHDYDVSMRLLQRIHDALRRAMPPGARLQKAGEGRFVLCMPKMTLAEATESVEALRRIGGQALIGGTAGTAMRTLSAGLIQVPANEPHSRAILRCGTEVARAKAFGGDRLRSGQDWPSCGATPTLAEIEAGLATGALRYHVQPIIDLAGGHVAGLEALLRWTQPDGTLVEPGKFVDVLERIPNHLVDLLPRLLEHLADSLVARPGLFVTINITGAVMDGPNSGSCLWLQEVLRRLPPDQLVVEIVESAVIARPARAQDLVTRLRAQGVRVALDDFGTGLSNLDRLRKMEVDILKMDRGFVAGLGGDGREEVILRNLVRMTQELGISLCAEGIEDETQRATVAGLGIRYGQGFHLGRPAPVEEWIGRLDAPV
ncbi:GGDEF domain-containing phosphodiesterase [Jannaschia sp.]|nr:GGDEF domain-containing phosphodiesterase [Jannaschia sp.]